MELWRKYRPKTLKEVVGQTEAKQILRTYIRNKSTPHAILFTGPSGCGKTTMCRILANELGCDEQLGYREINCGGRGGIDTIRSIADSAGTLPMRGRSKFYVLDEAHELTRPAQEALLKVAEETPPHVYIVLSTTDPKDLIRTIMTRFTEIKVNTLTDKEQRTILDDVISKQKLETPPTDAVIERVIEAAEGSARMAVNILGKVIKMGSEEEMLNAITNTEAKRTAFDLAKTLMGWDGGKATWDKVRKLLEAIKGQEEPERVRRLLLSLITNAMLKGGKPAARAAIMFECFRDNYYDTQFSGLVASCYACCYGN